MPPSAPSPDATTRAPAGREDALVAALALAQAEAARAQTEVNELRARLRLVTAQQDSTRQLRDSETRFRAVFEQSPMSMQRFAPDGSSLQTNRAFEQLFRLTDADLRRVGFNLIEDPQLERLGLTPLIQRAFSGEAVEIPPHRYTPHDSVDEGRVDERWLHSHLYPIKDHEDKIIEVIVIHEDVTGRIAAEKEILQLNRTLERRVAERTEALELEIEERSATERALQASEQRFRAIVEHQVELVSRYTPAGVNTYQNPAHERLYGFEPGQSIGWNWIEAVPPDVQALVRGKIAALTLQNPIFEVIHPKILPHNGRKVWEHWINRGIFDERGRLLEIQAVGRDVTKLIETEQALQESERKFRALFEGTRAGVVLLDGLTIIEVNAAWLELVGGPARDTVIGRSLVEFSAPLQGEGQPASEVARRLGAERELRGSVRFEWVFRRPDGTDLPTDGFSSSVVVGNRTLAQVIVHDIADRKRAERELRNALERERELGHLKSSFISMVSHEYRNPLGIILSSTELLKKYFDRLSPEERLESLLDIESATRRMTMMIDDLLLMGKAEAGKLVMAPGPIDLIEFCQTVINEALSSNTPGRSLVFTHDPIETVALSDEQILRVIVSNLLSNALKYSPPDRAPSLHVRRVGRHAIFTVHDDGIGIPESDRPALFQAFRRAKNVGPISGTGLGLFIVKHCVDLHEGTIDLDTAENRGTTVTVTLPMFNSETRPPYTPAPFPGTP